jgi:glycosyltransferase involved in cell wall biosynthesis
MDSERLHIMFVAPELAGGGAERILLQILKHLDRRRFRCSLALFSKKGALLGEVPEDVEVHDIGEGRHYRAAGLLRIVFKLRALFKRRRADVVFSVINTANFPAALAGRFAGSKVFVHEVSHPYLDLREEFAYPRIAMALLRMTYPLAHVQVALSNGIRESLIKDFGQDPEKIVVSYVPLDLDRITEMMREPVEGGWFSGDEPVVLGVGALIERKGFHVLLRAAAEAGRDKPLKVVILGEGADRERFEALASDLGISDRVFFPGFDPNPYRYFSRASAFVLSSFHEGLAIVVVEALHAGVPVVATDCPVGPAEILEGGRHGELVPVGDHKAMAAAIRRVLDDAQLKRRRRESGIKRAQDFERAKVMRELEGLIVRVAGRGH